MDKTSIILADDHSILRYGLRQFLSSAGDITIVGEASTGRECIRLFREQSPDVSVIDIGMPQMDGIEAAQSIRDIDGNAKIIFLSMHSDKRTLQKARAVDANGYLSKNVDKQTILEAIRAVQNGKNIFDDMMPESNQNNAIPSAMDNITKRESEIISLVVEGYSSPEIADKLFISRRTVDTHRNNIMQKLEVSNTASLVRLALQNNLVDASEAQST